MQKAEFSTRKWYSFRGEVTIGEGVDGAGFDQGADLSFSSNGEGTLTVIEEISPEKFMVVKTVPTQYGAYTMALDSKTNRVYLPVALFSKTETITMPNGKVRPAMVKDGFIILVVGK